MLDLDSCLQDLCIALEDHSPDHRSYFDPNSGEVEFHSEYYTEDDEGDPEARGLLYIWPTDSSDSYRDMEDFVARVGDVRARDLLERAITGRGAFRRFKDTLFEFPELREVWFRFHDRRMEHRAIEWLVDQELITEEQREAAIAARPEPELPSPPPDAGAIARAVAVDLRELYGPRLKDVILFGSQARGDAHAESDIDLMVVLDEMPSRYAEIIRMDKVMWRHSLANDTVVTEIPISEADYRAAASPVVIRAREEGFSVA
jgi:predicted nucleotidyltransferase